MWPSCPASFTRRGFEVQPSRSRSTSIPSPLRAERPIFWVGHDLCAHSSADGPLGYSHRLAVVSEVAVRAREPASVRVPGSAPSGCARERGCRAVRRLRVLLPETLPDSRRAPISGVRRFRLRHILTNAAATLSF